MIQLYGLRMSNYYSLTKALLIEKGVDFKGIDRSGRSNRANWR